MLHLVTAVMGYEITVPPSADPGLPFPGKVSQMSSLRRLHPRGLLWPFGVFGTKTSDRVRNVTDLGIYKIGVEAGFYGDMGRVAGFSTKLSNVYLDG